MAAMKKAVEESGKLEEEWAALKKPSGEVEEALKKAVEEERQRGGMTARTGKGYLGQGVQTPLLAFFWAYMELQALGTPGPGLELALP